MNLLETLLNGGERPRPTPARPSVGRPIRDRSFDHDRSFDRDRLRESARPVIPRGLRRALQESARHRETITLNPQEAAAILRVYEALEKDPFVRRDDAFTKNDLDALGVEVGGPGGNARGSEARRPVQERPRELDSMEDGLLSPSLAMQAPEATPLEDEGPPPEIGDELKPFQDDDGVEGVVPPQEDPDIMKLINGGSDGDGDDGLGAITSQTERQRQSAPVQTENAEVNEQANLLIESRRLIAQRKAERAANARRKKL